MISKIHINNCCFTHWIIFRVPPLLQKIFEEISKFPLIASTGLASSPYLTEFGFGSPRIPYDSSRRKELL